MADPYVSERREAISNMVMALEKVVAVNGFFITAGYGTYFGVWAVFREHLTPGFTIWSGLCLIVSASIFAGWHVYSTLTMAAVVTAIPNPGLPGFSARYRLRFGLVATVLIRRYYFAVTVAAIIPAFAALIIIIIGGIRGLGN